MSLFTFSTLPAWSDDAAAKTEIQQAATDNVFEIKVVDEAELSDLLKVVRKVMLEPKLYKYLNEVFKEHLIISKEMQEKYNLPSRLKGLSETQVLYILKNLPNYKQVMNLLDQYMDKIRNYSAEEPARKEFVDPLKKEFQSVLDDGEVVTELRALNDPSKALVIGYKSGKLPFMEGDIYFNRAVGDKPATDLKALNIAAIDNAKETISLDVFEFNLIDIAKAFGDAVKRGVKVKIGIDEKTTELAPENKAVLAYLKDLTKNYPELMTLTLVQSTGLNHQKFMSIDAFTKNPVLISSSGNFTQSCIGPEGDAVNIPENLRPKQSKPNTNNTVVYKNPLASLIAEHELYKTIDLKLRGQKGYPISGQYRFYGKKYEGFPGRSEMGMGFSPNGGMGNVNLSIYRPHIVDSGGEILLWQFVASSPDLDDAVMEVARKNPAKFKLRGVFHPSFAMQSWSLPLHFSGLTRDDKTKKYSIDQSNELRKVLGYSRFTDLQNNIRLNTREYRDSIVPVNGFGQTKISVKMHDKIIILPKTHTAFVGTSFNPSAAAEGNQEQILWIKNHPIVAKTIDAFESEFSRSNTTVRIQAKRRNAVERDMSGNIVPKDILDARKRELRATRFAEQDTTEAIDLDVVDEDPKFSERSPELEVSDILKSAEGHSSKACGRFYKKAH